MKHIKQNSKWSYVKVIGASIVLFFNSLACEANDLISLFPLNNYNQDVSAWINPKDLDYDKPLLNDDIQQKNMMNFYNHYFGSASPWNAEYITQIVGKSAPNDLYNLEQNVIKKFGNEDKKADEIGYGENFSPHDKEWIKKIEKNMNAPQLIGLIYQANHRGIAIDNLNARTLPTDDVHFFSYQLAGQGYPFDNLQMSALWAGTPVYVLAETQDHAWKLVITPDFIAWVKSTGIAQVNPDFVETWRGAAKNKLAAITQTETPIMDTNGKFLFYAYIGSVFPAYSESSNIKVMVPDVNIDRNAVIKYVQLSNSAAVFMPLIPTPHHFSMIMDSLIKRPYGWGGLYFYNDCSAELKSLFTPFGIWLARHSSNQIESGKVVDMSSSSPEKRLSYLIENGQRFLTLIYLGGHVILYVGNYANPYQSGSLMAMTYQNIWGLSPSPPSRRAVIGKAVLFPMLLQYPEDRSLVSLAAKKFFQVSFLNQIPKTSQKPLDLKLLIDPEN